MDKSIITFSANEQNLQKTGGIGCYASDTVSYIEAHFALGENWSGYDSIRAVWFNDYKTISTVLDSDGVCIVPHEVLTSRGKVMVNLVGSVLVSDELSDRLTTFPCEALKVSVKAKISGSETAAVTPSQFEQFVSIVISEVEKVTGMTAQAETLPAGSQATARYENGILYLGIPQGIQGERGETGADGNGIASVVYNADYSLTLIFDNGERFMTPPIRGERGPAGADGRDGTNGRDGADGVTPSLSIGTVETLEPTQDAYVTRRGTDDNPIFDFGIPQGPKGDKGDTGEVSQAQLDDAVSDLKSEITNITGVDIVGNWNNGYYLNLSGSTVDVTDFTTNAAWRVSVTECSAGDVFYISAEGGNRPRAYAFVDVSGNILEVASSGSTLDMRKKIAPTGAKYLVINDLGTHTSYKGMPVYLSIDKINESTASINNDVVFTSVTGKYIDYEGTDAPAEAFARSNPIPVNKGDIVKFTARGYSTNVAMIATSNSAGTVFTPKVISVDATVRLYTYTVEEDGYVVVSYNKSYTHDLTIKLYYSNEALNNRINQVDAKYPVDILSAFANITCIGDSLTYSQVYTGASTARQAFKPYPSIIADRLGAQETILAEPGDSASQCWSRFSNNIAQKDGQITIIYLGTNGGLTDTMATDMVGDDYNNWANTNTGCYGKLIAKSLSVNSRVILVKVYPQLTNASTTNSVIEAMGTRFNVPVLDNKYMSDLKYHSFPDGTDYNAVHYNDFGYAMFASQLMNNINNLSDADIIKIIPL